MRVYVAGAFDDYARIQVAQAELVKRGAEITFDWTTMVGKYPPGTIAPEDVQLANAVLDYEAVVSADAALLCTPDRKDWGCGCWCELGMFVTMKRGGVVAPKRERRLVVTGMQRDRTIFTRFADARFETDQEGVDYLLPPR